MRGYIGPPLADRGFSRAGRSSVWFRDATELRHLVKINVSRGKVMVQWGVLSEAVLFALWDKLPPNAADDVAYSAMTGWLRGVPGTTCPVAIDLPDASTQSDGALQSVSNDLATAADWLTQFDRRHDLVRYLLAVEEPKDRRGFLVPANLPLKLATCAFLLDADKSPNAADTASRALAAQQGLRSLDTLVQHRLRHLREIVAGGEQRG